MNCTVVYNKYMVKDEKYTEKSIENLIAYRANVVAMLIVTATGTTGLLFVAANMTVFSILFPLGLCFTFAFMAQVNNINREINDLLRRLA